MSRNYANVIAVYRGDTELDAVQKGDTLIWQRESEDHYLLANYSEATFNVTSVLDISINITQTKNVGTVVDWGDGSDHDLVADLSAKVTHSYAEAGVYTAKIYSYNDSEWKPGANNTTSGFMANATSKETDSILTRFICGDHCKLDGQYAFYECAALTYVDVGDNLVIGTNAFNGCAALATVIFPNGSITVQDYAFTGCKALSWSLFTFDTIGMYAFQNCTGFPANIEIRSRVLKRDAFNTCTQLRKVWLRSSIEKITAFTTTTETPYTIGPFRSCNQELVLYAEPASRPTGDADHTWETGFNGGSATITFNVVWGQTASPF